MEMEDGIGLLARDERYQDLVRQRSTFAWLLAGIILAFYFGYILLIAFRRDLLAIPIGSGVTTVGIPVGIGVILVGVALTGLYVGRANRDFDPRMKALLEEYGL